MARRSQKNGLASLVIVLIGIGLISEFIRGLPEGSGTAAVLVYYAAGVLVVKERDGNQSEPCGRNSGRHIGLARVILARVTLAVLSFTCAAGASAAAMTFKTRAQRAASLSEPAPRPSSAVTSGRPKFEALRT